MSQVDSVPIVKEQFAADNYAQALATFEQAYPQYAATGTLDTLRAQEYARLDRHNHIYLDYTGGGLYAESQLRRHMDLLSNGVFGNPLSNNPTSLAMTQLVDRARAYVLEFFNASPEEYTVIFTPNASGALKLVGESYPFGPGDHYALTFDNHNSVNGIREFARTRGAEVTYMPVQLPDMRMDEARLREILKQADPDRNNLLSYPAQSNFSGVQHSLEYVEQAQARGWDVLLDCAAFAPTNRLDLSQCHPDFVPLSFYKICGYPTGVGCLIAKRSKLAKLRRPWFAGGTITIASVQGEGWHYLIEGEAGFEDGTVNYLNLPAVEIGLRHVQEIGIDTIHTRVMALIGWLLEKLQALRHSNGAPMVRLYGPGNRLSRGGNIAFNFFDPDGMPVDYRHTEALAYESNISLRTGCFCNPGAGELAHNVTQAEMAQCFTGSEPVTFLQFFKLIQEVGGKSPSTIRISLGIASNFADVYRFMHFAEGYRDRKVGEFGLVPIPGEHSAVVRDTA